MRPTPRRNESLERIYGEFPTLVKALDYAARGQTGINFYSPKADLVQALPYSRIRKTARDQAQKLINQGVSRMDRVGLVADMTQDFVTLFLACQYAGLLAVPLPVVTGLGGRHEYESQLTRVLKSSGVKIALGPRHSISSLEKACEDLELSYTESFEDFNELPTPESVELEPLGPKDPSHIQFSSGSTRHPLGVLISQKALMENARSVGQSGLCFTPQDRVASWLPFYHDMGLIGFMLIPLTSQMSIDYLHTDSFARRPLSWLKMISDNKTSITFSPTFGYEICARRVARRAPEDMDLSCLRVAGIGGEMVQPDVLENFVSAFTPFGFDPHAFVPSYGMAEATLAFSFSSLGEGVREDIVSRKALMEEGKAVLHKFKVNGGLQQTVDKNDDVRRLARCGKPLPGYKVRICNDKGLETGEKQIGHIHIKGPSLMIGYDKNLTATSEVMDENGWLHTGDMGYLIDGELVITGRYKDLIIVNGRNIWPQDLEWHVEENVDILRSRSTAAFSVEDKNGHEHAYMLVQTKPGDDQFYQQLRHQVKSIIFKNSGIECKVVLVPPGSLPFTTSGKLSRTKAKNDFISGRLKVLDHDGNFSFSKAPLAQAKV